MKKSLVLLVAAFVLLGWSGMSKAEDTTAPAAKAAKDESLWSRGPKIADLKLLGLDDAAIAKAKDAVAPLTKQHDAITDTTDDAKKQKKELNEKRKKVVYDMVAADKKTAAADLLHYHPAKADK
jgi:hypothetical protein